MRKYSIERKTNETDISLALELDGSGKSSIDSGCAFLDHMLTLFSRHGRFDINLTCSGDTEVDYHHSVEDIGIVLGEAFCAALGDKKGIRRYGDTVLPMDEALILTAVDFSGRPYLGFDLDIPSEKIGDFDTELVREFWMAFATNARCALHIRQLSGINSHHIVEGTFKSCGRTLREAVSVEEEYRDEIPSTKGIL